MSEQGLPYDLLVDINGILKKVQVKSTRTHRASPQRKAHYPAYLFNIRNCGKGGRSSYNSRDVDLFALVCIGTKQVCYVNPIDMPSSISIRVDEFRGKYLNETQEARAIKVFELKAEGLTNSDIGRKINMDKSVVGRVLKGESKKTERGVYFGDLTLEKAL